MPCEQPPGLPEELPDDPAALKAIIADLELSNAALQVGRPKSRAPALTNAEAAGCASGLEGAFGAAAACAAAPARSTYYYQLDALTSPSAPPDGTAGEVERPSASTATRRGATGSCARSCRAGAAGRCRRRWCGGSCAGSGCARVLRAQGALQLLRRRDRRARAQPAAEGGRHPRLLRRAPQRGVGQRRDRVPPARRRPQGVPVARRRPVRRQARRLGRRHQPRRAPHRVVPRDGVRDARGGEAPVAHTDRGCHYRWPGWKAICGRHGLARSMSRKGHQPRQRRLRGVPAT